MSALAAPWEIERTRLWTLSALAVLLVHSAAMACLFLHASPRLNIVGSPAALNVELASLPTPAAATPPPPVPSTVQTRAAQVAGHAPAQLLRQLRPLADMQPIPQADLRTSSAAPPPSAAETASPPAELPSLTAPVLAALSSPQVPVGAQPNGGQLWLSEVKDQLQRYKQYPLSAVRAHQQDTVRLRFSVDRAGRITNVRIDSSRHYRALEQEVRKMLQMAGSLPPIPLDMPVEKVTWEVPVQFSLITPRPSPTQPHCAAPENPGPAPAGATSTLEQMNAYRARLNHYLADSSGELGCLGAAAATLAARNALTKQLHALVDAFNAQARLFLAQARALQAQQARRQQAQALAAGAYASCNAPPAPQSPPDRLTAAAAGTYRQRLMAYQESVHSYLACIQAKQLALMAAGPALGADAKAALDHTAVQDSNAAVLQFNQLAEGFNHRLERLREQVATAGGLLPEALVSAGALFPDSAWNLPAPLPGDECVRITRSGQIYQAQLCRGSYVTRASFGPMSTGSTDAPGDATLAAVNQIESIAAEHGVAGDPRGGKPILGTAVAPLSRAGQQTFGRQLTTFYSVSGLRVSGRHVAFNVGGTTAGASGPSDDAITVHFDLLLSADGRLLQGYCSTQQRRWQCTLARHAGSAG